MSFDLNYTLPPSSSITPAMLAQPFTRATAASLSGQTAVDFTAIPSWVKRITLSIRQASSNSTVGYTLRVGSGSIQTTGYESASCALRSAATGSGTGTGSTSFVLFADLLDVGLTHTGQITLLQTDTNIWVMDSQFTSNDGTRINFADGSVSLSGALDRVRFTIADGTSTFDNGTINIFME